MMSTGGPSNSAMNDVLGLLQVLEFLKDGKAVKEAIASLQDARAASEAAQAAAEDAQRAAAKADAVTEQSIKDARAVAEQAALVIAAANAREAEVAEGASKLQLAKEEFEALVVAHQAEVEAAGAANAAAAEQLLAGVRQLEADRAQLLDQQTQLDRRVDRLAAAEAEHKAKVDKLVALATLGA